MKMILRVLTIAVSLAFFGTGVQWIVAPADAAKQLGMELLTGMGASTQIGDISAFFFASSAMIALAQSDGYTLFILVLAGIGVLQICIGNILEPRLMGNSFNLSPIVILLNLGLWQYIWGIPGMFLCVPFLIILTIILSHFPRTRPIAIILSSDGRLRVPEDAVFEQFNIGPDGAGLLPPGQDSDKG